MNFEFSFEDDFEEQMTDKVTISCQKRNGKKV